MSDSFLSLLEKSFLISEPTKQQIAYCYKNKQYSTEKIQKLSRKLETLVQQENQLIKKAHQQNPNLKEDLIHAHLKKQKEHNNINESKKNAKEYPELYIDLALKNIT